MNRMHSYTLKDLTLPKVLAQQAARYGDKTYLTFLGDGRRFSYREVDTLSTRIAQSLQARGIGKGTHVSVLMDNSPEFLLLVFAIGKLGAVASPINTAARGEFLRYFLEASDSTVLAIDAAMLDLYREIATPDATIRQVIVLSGAGFTAPDSLEEQPAAQIVAFAALLDGVATPLDTEVHFTDLLVMPYTSGTTGRSKLSLYPQSHALLYGLSNAMEFGYTEDDVAYTCLPLYHNSGLLGTSMAMLQCGGSVVLAQRFSASRFWDELRDNHITLVNALGAMADFLWTRPPAPTDRDHRVRLFRLSPVPRYAREFEQRYGLTIVSAYGLSDFTQVTSFTAEDPREKLGSAGRPRRGIDVRIVDDDDVELPPGEPGEIIVRNNNPWNMSMGYYKRPEDTLTAWRNMWFHTGDRGYFDNDGYLYFVNRKKDSLRRRGENISAAEVESLILRHPAVAEAAVYPVQANTSEDEVAVTVVLKPDQAVTELELAEFCIVQMPYFMVPRFLQIAADLPRTPTFRVQKFKLTEAAQQDRSKLFDREKVGIVLSRRRAA